METTMRWTQEVCDRRHVALCPGCRGLSVRLKGQSIESVRAGFKTLYAPSIGHARRGKRHPIDGRSTNRWPSDDLRPSRAPSIPFLCDKSPERRRKV